MPRQNPVDSMQAGARRAADALYNGAMRARDALYVWADACRKRWMEGVQRAFRFLRGHEAFPERNKPAAEQATSGVAVERSKKLKSTAGAMIFQFFSFAWLVGAVGAFFAHNSRAFLEAFKATMNAAYHSRFKPFGADTYYHDAGAARVARSMVSALGALLGFVLSAVCTFVVANARAVGYMVCGMVSLVWNDQWKMPYQEKMHALSRHVLGFIGTVVGFAIGLVPFVVLGFSRTVQHTLLSTWRALIVGTNLMWRFFEGQAFTVAEIIKPARRSGNEEIKPHEVFGFGFLGVIVGSALAILPMAGIAVMGVCRAFIPSARWMASLLMHLVTPKNKVKIFNPSYPKNTQQRFTFGLPGLLVVTALAIVPAIFVFCARGVLNTARVWWSVVKGAFNIAVGRELSAGYAINDEKNRRWGYGILGFVLAAPVIALSALVWFVRVPFFYILATIVSVVLVPGIRLIDEAVKAISGHLRFGRKKRTNDERMERVMHRVYRALDADGVLPTTIPQDDAPDSPWITSGAWNHFVKFVRKTFSANSLTDDELLLAIVHEKLRDYVKAEAGLEASERSSVRPQRPDDWASPLMRSAFLDFSQEIDKQSSASASAKSMAKQRALAITRMLGKQLQPTVPSSQLARLSAPVNGDAKVGAPADDFGFENPIPSAKSQELSWRGKQSRLFFASSQEEYRQNPEAYTARFATTSG